MEQLVYTDDKLGRPLKGLHDADECLRAKMFQNKYEQVIPNWLVESLAKDPAPFHILKHGRKLATIELGIRLGH
jgi:hypothetical protein